jgi:hypothetical protein
VILQGRDPSGTSINKKEKTKHPSTSLQRSVITAVCLLVLDVFVFGQGAIAIITLVAVAFWFIPKTLFAWKRKEMLVTWALKVLIYSVMAGVILTANAVNNHLAKTKAEHLIVAVNKYKEQYQRYPSTLDELVPQLVTDIPKAKYTVLYNNFFYTNREGHATLMYFDFPPFGRPYYDFNKQEWGYID